jgi:RNA polymerase sigma-70 factor (ECF subfamily)
MGGLLLAPIFTVGSPGSVFSCRKSWPAFVHPLEQVRSRGVAAFVVQLGEAMSRTDLEDERWLTAFHAGEREVLAECYRRHGPRVTAAARALVGAVDGETVTHEVFYRLLTNPDMRASFGGGNFEAWLVQVVTRSAIDDLRRRRREVAFESTPPAPPIDAGAGDDALDAKRVVERFRASALPPELTAVFEARFLQQKSQRDAAAAIGIPRSTLAYQEQRIRALLERFLLGDERDDAKREEDR